MTMLMHKDFFFFFLIFYNQKNNALVLHLKDYIFLQCETVAYWL